MIFVLGKILHPPVAGEESDADQDGEHNFGGAGVHDRQPVVEKLEDGEAAEDALEDYAAEGKKAERTEPGSFVFFPEEYGKNGDEYAEDDSNEAVGMLVEGATGEEAKRRKPGAEGSGQSATARAASFEVTRAPAVRRRAVQHTTKIANL